MYGRGYGHGVGLSQYGARGRALAGQDAAAILGHYYKGATLGSIAATTQIRVLVLSHWGATPTAPLLIYGRTTAWSIDGIAKTYPIDSKLRVTPTTTTTSTGTRTTWRIRVNGPTGTILHDGPKPASLVVRGATGSSRLQVYSKPGTYDQYRGILRILTSSVAPTVTVVNELRMEHVPARRRARRDAVDLADRGAQGPDDRRPVVRRAPAAPGRVLLRRHRHDAVRRSTAASHGEKAQTNATVTGDGRRGPQERLQHRQHPLPLDRGRRDRAQRERVRVLDRGEGRRRRSATCAGRWTVRPTASAFDAAAPYATWKTKTYTRAQLSAIFATDSRTSVGTLTKLDLRDRGVSGRLIGASR